MECQFIIDGISFDFWPISWERAERMANAEDWSTTIIADCELLYVRSDEDLAKFMELRQTISNMGSESNKVELNRKAEEALRPSLISIANMRITGERSSLSYIRIQSQSIAANIFKSLGLLNQTYYTRMWGHYREQVRNFALKPEHLDKYLDTMMFSLDPAEIVLACEQLTADTLQLISEQQHRRIKARSYQQQMKGYYEEERGMMNKLLTACEIKHYETAFFAATGLQESLSRMLYAAEKGRWPGLADEGVYREFYDRYGYPDLVSLLNPEDFEPLRLAVLEFIDKIENHLKTEGVLLNQFDSIAAFKSHYITKI